MSQKKNSISRRVFISLGLLGSTGAIFGGFVFFESFENLARKIILKDTSSLSIDPGEYEKFFKDVAKTKKWDSVFPHQNQQLLKWHYYLDNLIFTLPYRTSYKNNRSRLVGTFLLSTDFFTHKMDEKRPIRYNVLFDPYLYPCSNPFSNNFYPA
jgi:hypothetical protein